MASGGGVLYTPEVLVGAVRLASYPFDEALPWKGEARSRSCGSTLAIAMDLDGEGRIVRLGLRPHACAIGQAAAAVFADHGVGRTREEIAATRAGLAEWLSGDGPMPPWPGLDLISAARAYPARHGAILLAWDAALAAMAAPPLERPGQEGRHDGG